MFRIEPLGQAKMTETDKRAARHDSLRTRRRCPRCRQGKLFSGLLTLRKKCEGCGLDYSFADAGDGPAIFRDPAFQALSSLARH